MAMTCLSHYNDVKRKEQVGSVEECGRTDPVWSHTGSPLLFKRHSWRAERERAAQQESTSPERLAETTSTSRAVSEPVTMGQGKYPIFFLTLAVVLDVAGLILFFVGIFARLSFWDFFVLSGPLLIFLSLVFWIFWYMGNLTVTEEELNLTKSDIL